MKLRPKPIPTLATAICLALLLSLGFWQLSRNAQTNAKLAAFAERLDAPALDASALTTSPADLWHRQVALSGTFRSEPTFLVGRAESSRPGYGIIQVLDVDEGPAVLVDRGWVAHPRLQEGLGELPDRAEVSGVLLPPAGGELVPLPAQDGIAERWPTRSSAAMARRVDGGVLPVLLVQGEEVHPSVHADPAQLLVRGWWVRPTARPHLEYAATWFAIALVLLWVWGLASRVEDDG